MKGFDKMIKRVVLMYLFIFTFGFIYMFIAGLHQSWFYSFGWFIAAVAIGTFLAKFPVPIMQRWVGIIIQFFALFIPIKILMIIHDAGIVHFPRIAELNPLLILGQLYLVIVVLISSFSIVVWLGYRAEKKRSAASGYIHAEGIGEEKAKKISG
ncbi:hypothetical protein ACJ2A9_11835 [Anaerobacillus sp. MEB173]|uniref:hypothetical protein n=1 Tax=Anaerobacillus sp. MEB173 TaxID=3383345 RepID=UPI003F91BD1C